MGKKIPITFLVDEEDFKLIIGKAKKLRLSRAGFVRATILEQVEASSRN